MRNMELDLIDSTIIKMHLSDARVSLTELAQACGVSPNAIFKRIEGLRARKIIVGSTTLFNPRFLDEGLAATVELTVEQSESGNVLSSLRSHPKVLMCFEGIGRCNVFALIGAKCVGELDCLKEEIRGWPGIKRMMVSVRVDEFEFTFQNLDLMRKGGEIDG